MSRFERKFFDLRSNSFPNNEPANEALIEAACYSLYHCYLYDCTNNYYKAKTTADPMRLFTSKAIATFFIGLQLASVSLAQTSNEHLESQIREASADITIKQKSRDALQKELDAIEEDLRINRIEKSDLDIETRQLQLQERKIRLLSDKTEEQKQEELKKLQYKIRVAEIGLKKNERQVEELSKRKEDIGSRLERLDLVLATMHEKLEGLKKQRKLTFEDNSNKKKLAELERKAAQEKRLQEQLQKQQQEAAKARLLAAEEEQQKRLEEEEARHQRELLHLKNQNLPAHEAAMNMARLIAQEPMQGAPAFGPAPSLLISRPVNSKAQHISNFKHLGNNQYFAQIEVRKGQQKFFVNDKGFVKMIAPAFDKKQCLVLVDARNAVTPVFQLYPIE